MKKLIITGIIYLLFFFNKSYAFASDQNITCSEDLCSPQSSSLFSSTVWAPGVTNIKTVNISNTSQSFVKPEINILNFQSSGDIDKTINLNIRKIGPNNIIWAGSLHDFSLASPITLDNISPDNSQDYSFEASMNSEAGNEYQGFNLLFDLRFVFTKENLQPPTTTLIPSASPTPTSNNSQTNNSNNSGGTTNSGNTSSSATSPTATPTQNPVLFSTLASPSPTQEPLPTGYTENILGLGTTLPVTIPNLTGAYFCTDSPWWIIILAFQLLSNIIAVTYAKLKNSLYFLPFQLLANLLSVYFLWRISCSGSFLVVALFIGLFGFSFLFRKIKNEVKKRVSLSFGFEHINLPSVSGI